MTNKTATQLHSEVQTLERNFGPVPREIETEEDYLRWALRQIEEKARKEAEPYINRLLHIESMKPTPVFVLLEEIGALGITLPNPLEPH